MLTSPRRILITGIAGFIGFHLACHLAQKGDKIVGIDDFNDYYSPRLKEERAAALVSQYGIEIERASICDRAAIGRLFNRFQPTHIVHLAGYAGVRYSLENPYVYLSANIEGFITLLEEIKTHPIPFIYASSSSVYGANVKTPFDEEDKTDAPVSLYGATKKANEVMAHVYHHTYGIPMTGLRFFTVYGPWGRPDMAYFSFADKIFKAEPIEVFNEGNMYRDFTYIDDIVDGISASLDLAAPFEIFNLGNHRCEKLSEMIALLEKHLGKKAIQHFRPMPPGDVPITYASIEHPQEKLGFSPKVSLDEGLRRFSDWYLSYRKK